MNLNDIREMIRLSIKRNITNYLRERKEIPKNLSKFIEQAEPAMCSDVTFSDLHELWQNLSLDTADLHGNELISEWNSSLVYNVDLLNCSENSKNNLINHLKK